MNNLRKVLLLGGSQHLRVIPIGADFGTPISHCNGVDFPERYHRAVFYPSVVGDRVAEVWYVYVADDYQLLNEKFSDSLLLDELSRLKVAAHMTELDPRELLNETRLETE